ERAGKVAVTGVEMRDQLAGGARHSLVHGVRNAAVALGQCVNPARGERGEVLARAVARVAVDDPVLEIARGLREHALDRGPERGAAVAAHGHHAEPWTPAAQSSSR